MKKSALFLSLAASFVAATPSMLHASAAAEYVYVESNIGATNANSILAFKRAGDGSLTPLPGSPFLTGGAGIFYTGTNLGAFDNDQEIVVNSTNTKLYAVNAGSDTISVFDIARDGSLSPIAGSPFPSGGADPGSIGIDGDTLFVVNQSSDYANPSSILPNYTAFHILANGAITPFSNNTNTSARAWQGSVSVALGSAPSQAFLIPSAHTLIGADFLGGVIQRFQYSWQGIRQLPTTTLPASVYNNTTTPRLPLGLWSHPTAPVLYVGFVTAAKLGVYHYSPDGALVFLRAVPSVGKGLCWIRSNASGSRLYSSDTSNNQISVYDTTNPEYPVEIQTFNMEGGGNAFQISVSPDGKTLYAISQNSNLLHTLSIQADGTLSEPIAPTPLTVPAGTHPQGVAVVDVN